MNYKSYKEITLLLQLCRSRFSSSRVSESQLTASLLLVCFFSSLHNTQNNDHIKVNTLYFITT